MFSSVINFINNMGNTSNPNPPPTPQENVTTLETRLKKILHDPTTPTPKQDINTFGNFQSQQRPNNQYTQQQSYQFAQQTRANNQQYKANPYGYQSTQATVPMAPPIQSNPSPDQLQMQLEAQMQQLRLLQQAQQLERQRLDLARQQRDLEAQAASQQLQQHEIIRLQQKQAQRLHIQQQQQQQLQQAAQAAAQQQQLHHQQTQAQAQARSAAEAQLQAQLEAKQRLQRPQAHSTQTQQQPLQQQAAVESPVQDEKYPVIFHWSHGGRDVYVAYSGDNWSQKYRMHRSHTDFSLIMEIIPGVYHYKFIVDNQWRCAPDQKHVRDVKGAYSNVLDVRSHSYQQVIDEQKRERKRKKQKAQYEYTQNLPKSDHYVQDPPICPIHLHKVILNNNSEDGTDSISIDDGVEEESDYNNKKKKNGKVHTMELPTPLRVSLNHLYVSDKREEEVVTLGMTERYKDKFFTTVYYTPIDSRGQMESTFEVSNNYY